MREGWTYKKLGEVCKVIMGQSPDGKSVNDSNGVEFHQGKVFFGEKYLKVSNSFTEQPSKIAEPNSVLLCVRAPVGVVNLTLRRICIGRGLCAIQPNDKIIMPFIYYALTTKQTYFDKNSTGSTFKAISSNIVTNTVIPVPPVGEQERIVAELDLLSGVIEKKKEQLKAYDQLAQSIFYTMFGDPIDNPKGWEVKTIGNTCTITCGQDYKTVEDENGKYPIYGTGGIMGWANQFRCPKDSVIIGRKGNINNPILVNADFWNVDTAFGVTPNNDVLSAIYFFFFCKEYDFTQHDVSVTIPSLRRTDILKIKLPVPPLSLQQEFADKIEAIEQQKALVQQSIDETQTMFDYTMDKYFG